MSDDNVRPIRDTMKVEEPPETERPVRRPPEDLPEPMQRLAAYIDESIAASEARIFDMVNRRFDVMKHTVATYADGESETRQEVRELQGRVDAAGRVLLGRTLNENGGHFNPGE